MGRGDNEGTLFHLLGIAEIVGRGVRFSISERAFTETAEKYQERIRPGRNLTDVSIQQVPLSQDRRAKQ
jgi:hypothetical protein